jgi:hypothetical protein
MTTAFSEFKRQVLLKVQRSDGLTTLATEQAINDAQKVIASVKDFDELMTLDTANAVTAVDQKLYNIDTGLGLTRPKDIYSIRLMDTDNSRKLTYVSLRKLDEVVPYTEMIGTGRSTYYTIRGRNIELYRIPDAIYHLYIQHSQWPTVQANDSDVTDYLNIDHVIVALATEMTIASLEGTSTDWFARAKQLLGIALNEEETRPDQVFVAQPFNPYKVGPMGEYWLNPWVKHQPE